MVTPFVLRGWPLSRRKGCNPLFVPQRHKTPRTFRYPGHSVSQSTHTGLVPYRNAPLHLFGKRKFGGVIMTKDMLEKFFQRYGHFFMKSLGGEIDGDEMAELYAPEFIAASPIGVRVGKNNAEFREALSGGYAQYRKLGTKGMRVRGVEMLPMDALHCVAKVAWTASYEVASKQQVDIDFDVYYLMQERNGKLRIFGWISGNEQELLKEYGVV